MDADNRMAIRRKAIHNLSDLISNLPDNLVETILMKMPLRDAVRTCILSKRWRYSWVKLPHLILDASFWRQSLQNQFPARTAKFGSILFRILLLHQGPITSINLHIPLLESPPEIDTFLTSIVRNGVQSFYLDNVPGGHCKLHSSLFTCPTLNLVRLYSCEVNLLPCTFERPSNLTTLALLGVTISAQELKRLVSSCPSLHTLRLRLYIDIQCLEIISPSLRYFSYCCLSSSRSLLAENYDQQQPGGILKLLGGSPNLECLGMDNNSVKSLAAGGSPTRLPTGILNHLKSIHLRTISLGDVVQFSFLLCLIRSSPNLQKLKVDRSIVNNNNIIENLQDDYSDLTLNHLLEVEILSVVGGSLELKLIKILLTRSPSLRKMNISLSPSSDFVKLKIMKEIVMFRRAAPNVEVLIKD